MGILQSKGCKLRGSQRPGRWPAKTEVGLHITHVKGQTRIVSSIFFWDHMALLVLFCGGCCSIFHRLTIQRLLYFKKNNPATGLINSN